MAMENPPFWSCISYWKWWFSNVMLVFSGVIQILRHVLPALRFVSVFFIHPFLGVWINHYGNSEGSFFPQQLVMFCPCQEGLVGVYPWGAKLTNRLNKRFYTPENAGCVSPAFSTNHRWSVVCPAPQQLGFSAGKSWLDGIEEKFFL